MHFGFLGSVVLAVLAEFISPTFSFPADIQDSMNTSPNNAAGFARVIGEGLSQFRSGDETWDMWDIVATADNSQGSTSVLDFESHIVIRKKSRESGLIYESHLLDFDDWSPVTHSSSGPGLIKVGWDWTNVEFPLEAAIIKSQDNPQKKTDWTTIILSISVSERQLTPREPLWKFYSASARRWTVGVGAISGEVIYGKGPLLSGGVAGEVTINVTSTMLASA